MNPGIRYTAAAKRDGWGWEGCMYRLHTYTQSFERRIVQEHREADARTGRFEPCKCFSCLVAMNKELFAATKG